MPFWLVPFYLVGFDEYGFLLVVVVFVCFCYFIVWVDGDVDGVVAK